MPKPKSMGFMVLSRMSSCANIVRIAIIANVFPTAEAKRAFFMAGMCSAHAAKKKPTITKTATNSLPFEKTQVKNVVISDLSPVSFTASWDALADAQGYKLYLMRNFYDGETITTSYDFTNEITGMPFIHKPPRHK